MYLASMRVLIAPDKFKDSMTAREICSALATGINQIDQSIEVEQFPLADGGEGSLNVIEEHLDCERISVQSVDPLGRSTEGYYLRNAEKAFIELATCSGLELLRPHERNPMITSTKGTGLVIKEALLNGAKEIYLFIGGSSTNDGGMGILESLGFQFLDNKGALLAPVGQSLLKISQIISPASNPKKYASLTILCDVQNKLWGPKGAAQVFAPQKGASPSDVKLLDEGLKKFAEIVFGFNGMQIGEIVGGGAAGGIGAGLGGLMDAKLVSGIDAIMDLTFFEQGLDRADWVITGEGKLDSQSLEGKVVSGVVGKGRERNINLGLVCGDIDLSTNQIKDLKVTFSKTVLELATDYQDAILNADIYLQKIGRVVAKEFFQ